MNKVIMTSLIVFATLLLSACGGSSGDASGEDDSPIVVSCDSNLSANIVAGNNLTATCSVSDADGMGDVEILLVTVPSGTEIYSKIFSVNGSNPNIIESSFNIALDVGDYNLSVSASGNGGTEFEEVYSFRVNAAPVIDDIPTQNVDDNGGAQSTTLLTVTGTGIQAGATFSIVNDPTNGGLTIDSATGELVYDDDINPSQSFEIAIKVINPDGGEDTEIFTLNVNSNL